MSLNRVTLVGRLSNEPEIRATGSGLLVALFSLAVKEYYRHEERASFFSVEAYGKTAELIQEQASKGSLIGLDGFLKQDRWKTREKLEKTKVVVVAKEVMVFDHFKNDMPSEESIFPYTEEDNLP
ncbi:MAG: single-stranded DNA-binding protein [Spirochaetae bacterium HGW-Spirochaetae-6]|nr:MAG: single-stranded DNA-binding protein [Spirochaetae bacterium HGW-Spirochaetae-6]